MALIVLDMFVRDNASVKQTDSVKFREALKNCRGHVFLVITDSLADGSRIVKHRTRNELGFKTLTDAAVYFHKPDADLPYWVLKREFRTIGHLLTLGFFTAKNHTIRA